MKIIGIIGAMEEEVISLRRKMDLKEVHQIAGMDFYEGTMQGIQVIVVRCGIGKVNAAVCTQILIDKFSPNYIINTGVAGGLHPVVNIGDVVISNDTVQQDMDTSKFGDAKDIMPRMENTCFKVNNELIEYAKLAAAQVLREHKIWVGHIVSEDQFVASIKVKQDIYTTFTAYCAEMEGAAIAHTCYLNQIPFVIIRIISDKVDSTSEMNFDEFVNLVGRNISKIIENIVASIK